MADTAELLSAFNDAFNRHDVDDMMALMSNDCVFENTYPPPDGERLEGQEEVKAFWTHFFSQSPHASIEIEEMIITGARAVQRWRYRWMDAQGTAGYVRGVDVFRFRGEKIVEKLSYVKG